MSDLRHLERDHAGARIDLLADPALSGEDAAQIFECLLGRMPHPHLLDGDRSVVFPARSSGVYGGIKIKGAGFRGGRVRMGRRHDKPYALPRYDAEGAATMDAAKDHGRAYAGGMSYQQARHEFTVCRHLVERGVRIFPSLGYGALRRDGHTSWFCVLDWPFGQVRDWFEFTRERSAVERIATAFGDTQKELARHDVYLILSGLVEFGGALLRKDFHTAHIAGPNDSFLTRLSYYLFDINFVLAQFDYDLSVPDIADHRTLAKAAYVRALTGQNHSPASIGAFKQLLVELKYADWEMEQRMERLAPNPVGRTLLEAFLAGSGERALFGALPPVADPPPAPAAPPLQRIPWLHRIRPQFRRRSI
jgi:hypothetical protein